MIVVAVKENWGEKTKRKDVDVRTLEGTISTSVEVETGREFVRAESH